MNRGEMIDILNDANCEDPVYCPFGLYDRDDDGNYICRATDPPINPYMDTMNGCPACLAIAELLGRDEQGLLEKSIFSDEQKSVLHEAISVYGINSQLWMAVEEMSELTKEICKERRKKSSLEKITDEIADVTVMIEQLKMIFGISDDMVNARIQYKVKRLESRLRQGGS